MGWPKDGRTLATQVEGPALLGDLSYCQMSDDRTRGLDYAIMSGKRAGETTAKPFGEVSRNSYFQTSLYEGIPKLHIMQHRQLWVITLIFCPSLDPGAGSAGARTFSP